MLECQFEVASAVVPQLQVVRSVRQNRHRPIHEVLPYRVASIKNAVCIREEPIYKMERKTLPGRGARQPEPSECNKL